MVLRTNESFFRCLKEIRETKQFVNGMRKALGLVSVNQTEIDTACEPTESFVAGLEEEARHYFEWLLGNFETNADEEHLHMLLIPMRIASGMSQVELAVKLGLSEEELERREYNDYFRIAFEEAERTARACGYTLERNGSMVQAEKLELQTA